MAPAVVFTQDLMVASRFSSDEHEIFVARSSARAEELLEAHPSACCFVDLMVGAEWGEQVAAAQPQIRFVGFAPHVHVGVLEAARRWCAEVLPRGAVIKQLDKVIERHS